MRSASVWHTSEWSLKRKLFVYMLLLALLLLAILAIGLSVIGHTNSTADSVLESLELQMAVFEKDIAVHFDQLAASAVTLSVNTTKIIENHLDTQGISFSALHDRSDSITQLQEAMIDPMRQKLLQANCSGVFALLNTTVNSSLPESSTSKTGLYLQTNGYDQNRSEIMLYRGIPSIAKAQGIMPHRKWRLEFRTDLFPDYAQIAASASVPLGQAYRISEPFQLPGTSEYAILLTVPIVGTDGTYYGICGYEVGASYFTTYHEQPSRLPHLSCLLATNHDNVLITSEALSCGSSDAYFHTLTEDYAIIKTGDGFSVFQDEGFSYLGLPRRITLSPGGLEHLLVVMIPKADYDRMLYKRVGQTAVFLILLLFFTVSFCKFFSKRFLAPLLTALEQIKSDQRGETDSGIPEILDLIAYLNQQEKAHGVLLADLEEKHLAAENKNLRLQAEYDRALNDFQRIQLAYTNASEELLRVQTEIQRLAYSRKTEVDPADYQYFLAGLQTLTEAERNLFEHYLSGKSVKEILELTGIKESTLKYHNHNLLGKLGVSSRKQMLRYAEVMRHYKEEAAP